jgi:tetratricopeptide (TPR) repeat protein
MKADEADVAQYAEESLSLARDAGDKPAVARSLLALGFSKARFADETERRDALPSEELTEGLALAREAGDLVLAARFLGHFGTAALEAGDFGRARRFHRESLAMCEEAESEQGIARASIFLAGVALHEGGQVDDAFALYRRGLRLAHRLGWTEAVVYALGGLACADAELGQSERAAKLVGAESRLVEEVHLRIWRFQRVLRERAAAALRRDLDAERLDRLLAEGRAMSLDEAVAIALDEAD